MILSFSKRFQFLLLTGMAMFLRLLPNARGAEKAEPTMAVPTSAQLAAIAAWLPDKPQGAGAPIEDRAAWAVAAQQPAFQKQVRDAALYAGEPIPELTQALFDDFLKTGHRDTYEKPFQKRTTRLIAFVIAECVRNDGSYLPLIEAEIGAILAEKSWAVPAHLANTPPGRLDRDVDLAAGVRAWNLALADYWLGNKLQPGTRKAIRSELRRRVFDDYEAAIRSGKPAWWWMTAEINWNPVCTSGVLGAALTILDSPGERAIFVQAALDAMPLYLRGFGNDGYCLEGISYWSYGFGTYLCLAETLYQQTQGRINLYEGAKLRQIALYRSHLEIAPGVFPAFGDAHPTGNDVPTALLSLINRRWAMGWTTKEADPALSDMFETHPLGDRLFGFGLFGFPLPSFSTGAAGSPGVDSPQDEAKRFFFKDAGVLVCRAPKPGRPSFGLAIKGGRNGLPHGHNDNGSYVVVWDGEPLVVDPGMEQYTSATFGPRRFESTMMNSYGHDVPYVGRTLQKSGPEALGKIVQTRLTDAEDTLKMDLTTSYAVPSLASVTRTYRFNRVRPSVEIVDEAVFTSPTDYGSALVTLSEWREEGPGDFVIQGRNGIVRATVTVEGEGEAIENKVEPITGFHLLPGIKPIRLGVNVARPVTRLILRTMIVPETNP